MQKCLIILPIIFLVISSLACSLSGAGETPTVVTFQETATLVELATATPLPTNTPVPTIFPAVEIENADRSFFHGNWDQAIMDYSVVYKIGNESEEQDALNAAALLGIGRSYYEMGEFERSLEPIERVLVDYPKSSLVGAAHFAKARVQEALELYSQAAESYGQYLEARPGLIDSYVLEWQGDALITAGEFTKAIDLYQSAIGSPRLGDTLGVELKIANTYAALGDHPTAILAYKDVYTRTNNEYTRAQVDYYLGRSYTALGQMDEAYTAYLDAVENYPLSYDTYQALITLVEAGYPVDEFDRGLVDYFAGQYSLAIAALDRSLAQTTENAGAVYYYKGLAYRALDDPLAAIDSWRILMEAYPEDDHWSDAWGEVAYTQWAYLDQKTAGAQTLLDFVANHPAHPRAAEFLFDAARITERDRDYEKAAEIWTRIPPEYPSSGLIYRAIYLAGISYYRAKDFNAALSTFEWSLNSAAGFEQKSAAYFWLAKTYQALGNSSNAEIFFENAASEDPTGYYSERAGDILKERPPFDSPVMYDLVFDEEAEKQAAENWMRATFAVPSDINLSDPGSLAADLRFTRGSELWNLGLYDMAREEFEAIRADIRLSPVENYRLMNAMVELGLYRTAVFAARQVLNLNDMSDAETLGAPDYFNHIRFGSYYKELVLPNAKAYEFHPLFLFSVLRQESLFEGFVRSDAGARGLMQIMPATGESIAFDGEWPPGFTSEDLYRPYVSVRLGADYLATQRDYFGGDLYAALAAYNAGPGNTLTWLELADGDRDLFLEIIRFPETQDYIRGIYEVFSIYRYLYDRSP